MADFRNDWMWSEACEMLARAERMHREFFRPTRTATRVPTWEPPADVLETDRAVLVFFALPGVDPDRVEAVIEDDCLVVAGLRILPPELQTATIHRLELPKGRFERRMDDMPVKLITHPEPGLFGAAAAFAREYP